MPEEKAEIPREDAERKYMDSTDVIRDRRPPEPYHPPSTLISDYLKNPSNEKLNEAAKDYFSRKSGMSAALRSAINKARSALGINTKSSSTNTHSAEKHPPR